MGKIKIVYHGSPVRFYDINLSVGGVKKDFGKGFYLSDDIEHAFKAGRKKARIFETDKVYIYQYLLPVTWPDNIEKHVFREPNKNWLDYIIGNRFERNVPFYDVVYGPTADENTPEILRQFIARGCKEEEVDRVIRELKPSVYARQVCIKSEQAKKYITGELIEVRDLCGQILWKKI